MTSRFRLFSQRLNMTVDHAKPLIQAGVALHNFLIAENRGQYLPPGYADHLAADGTVVEGAWRQDSAGDCYESRPIARSHNRHPTLSAMQAREALTRPLPYGGQHSNSHLRS